MIKKVFKSFPNAIRGFFICLIFEHNMKFHVLASFFITIVGLILGLTRGEWILIIACIGIVWFAEVMNTAIEDICDVVRDNLNLDYKKTKDARDLAAGAVLVISLMSAIIGGIIFIPKLIAFFGF
jgi:diacylglycerol kinase (ATP)